MIHVKEVWLEEEKPEGDLAKKLEKIINEMAEKEKWKFVSSTCVRIRNYANPEKDWASAYEKLIVHQIQFELFFTDI